MKKLILPAMFLLLALMTACAPKANNRSFSEAHDAFETKLAKQANDQDEIPEPPEGVFDLAYFDSKVGRLASYVSSNPEDGQKHPLIIWVVGGWSNGIDEFAWSYAPWDNDQSAAAFREAGILMMYPSFRGANGNPGYYETLFGEIDDIVSAYEFAASLPYVDPERIYLGGHSTGGTRALLASEYTDKFRAVFSFGPVDEIKQHNSSQFTFDTSNKDEHIMRSPIYWLDDIKTPTFIIEGQDGNSEQLKNIEKKSENENIHCYIIDDADHFAVLAPVTRLVAQKILDDTGANSNITLTKQELQDAMKKPPVDSLPAMLTYRNDAAGFSLLVPVIWEMEVDDEYMQLLFSSAYDEDNFWDSSLMVVDVYDVEYEVSFEQFVQDYNGSGFLGEIAEVNGQTAYIAEGGITDGSGTLYFNKAAAFQQGEKLIAFCFYVPEGYKDAAKPMFQKIIDSIVWE